MVQVSIGLIGLERLLGGDFAEVVGVAALADEAGIDMVSITDHVVMGEHLENYPYGAFPMPLDYPWFEPLVVLAAIAGSTSRIKLSAGVLIAPLRPAVLLAKQLATLDVMSRGRVEIGIGIGWQREEYDAAGIPWEGRYTRMDEQVKVCKLLWTTAPAHFAGSTVTFDAIHAYPRPVQANGIPIWYGLKPTPRNFDRIAELGDGWVPMERRPDVLATHIADLRKAFQARGRDPDNAQIRVGVRPGKASGEDRLDLDETLAGLGPELEAGATTVEFLPSAWCRDRAELPDFFARLATWRDGLA
jgi:probable F420-dependent oxidoreductase